jgi:hypothetical protein
MSSEGSTGEQRAETAPAYKSTPLRPAIIMTAVLVWALVVALIVRVPAWASIFLAVLTGASFLAFLGGYLYLFARDRESLRTGRMGRGALAAKPAAGERGALAAGNSMPVGGRESSGVPVSEAKLVVERHPH